jgi:hypothetical protein
MKTYNELKEVTFLNMYKSLKKYRKKNRKQKVCIESLTKQLASANLETTRKGFWLGFEDARCHPQENNILMQWESTLIFIQLKQLEGKG